MQKMGKIKEAQLGLLNVECLQSGGGCDQNPVSVHTMDPSPISRCASLQLKVRRAPTA